MQIVNATGRGAHRTGIILLLAVFTAGMGAAMDVQARGGDGKAVMPREQPCVHGMNWNKSMPPCAKPTVVVDDEKVKIVFALDDAEFFGVDKATLNDTSMKDLDRLVSAIDSADDISSILITGHADRLGPEPYNNRLAQTRANNVKTYLVGKGLPGEKIVAVGEGLDEPWASCPDSTGDRALIKCLAPNRRVDVEAVFVDDVNLTIIAVIPPAE